MWQVLEENHRERDLKAQSKQLRTVLHNGGDVKAEERFYLKLPKMSDHRNHVTGEVRSVSSKIFLKKKRIEVITSKKNHNNTTKGQNGTPKQHKLKHQQPAG